ncbi:MAG TPA: hypothetical protein VGS08_04870 [Candidatus Saccharimonadales bacterium]|nr:hypothetical protein [Candidatus Saccharimonadales bacterium]
MVSTTTLKELEKLAERSLRVIGPSDIQGEARVQGSKNIVNKIIAAMIAMPGNYEIHNFPLMLDALQLLCILEDLCATVRIDAEHHITYIDTTSLQSKPIPYARTKSSTGAFGFAGAMLGRFGEVQIGKPGGDRIGARPVDLHVAAFRALGADIEERPEGVQGQVTVLTADTPFTMRVPSTGAAVNFILAIVAAKQQGTLKNAPIDSDMIALYQFLESAGVQIKVSGTTVRIDATCIKLPAKRFHYVCPPDRNDGFTWLAYGALSRSGLTVKGMCISDVRHGIDALLRIGVEITSRSGSLFVKSGTLSKAHAHQLTFIAGVATEFHSDWAPLLEAVLVTVPGDTRVVDSLFSDRVRQAEILQDMGAHIRIHGGPAPNGIKLHFTTDPMSARYIVDIHGPTALKPIRAAVGYDVRACAAAVLATTQADGESVLTDIKALYRGYENIVKRLQAVGVDIDYAQ